MSHAKREVGAACALLFVQRRSRDNRLVGCTIERVFVKGHMANYHTASESDRRRLLSGCAAKCR